MKYLLLLSLVCMCATISQASVCTQFADRNYNIFGNYTQFIAAGRSLPSSAITIVIQMPVLLFMDRSIQFCVINALQGYAGLIGPDRLYLYRYDNVRLFKRSESVKLTFYGPASKTGQQLYMAIAPSLSVGSAFPIPLKPADTVLAARVMQIDSGYLFRVTFFGPGAEVGAESYDSSNDIPNDGYSNLRVEDYFYIILGIIFLLVIIGFFVYGFIIQPHYL